MAGNVSKYIVFFSLMLVLSSCELVCICPENCTVCGECGCVCGATQRHRTLLVQSILPQDHSAESFTLRYNENERKFYGSEVSIATDTDYCDFLIFNNDGEAVIVKDNIATTNLEYGNDTLRYQPTPFYSLYQPNTMIGGLDTLRLELKQRVFEYEIEVELNHNDGRVAGISRAVLCGMAKELNLITDDLTGEAAYLFDMAGDATIATGTLLSFGSSDGEQELILYYLRDNGDTERYSTSITQLIQPLKQGGKITIVIDVETEIPATPNPINGGFDVGLNDWDNSTNKEIIL